MKRKCVAFIFARGGSKGIPKKNIKMLGGQPLLAYSIRTAQSSELIDRVIVSTDDPDIASMAKEFGAEVPFMRPKNLATDTSPEWLSWRHAIIETQKTMTLGKIDTFVTLPPTSPFRSVEDINNCIRAIDDNNVDIVITGTESGRNPYFNMVKIVKDGSAEVVIRPEKNISRRQDAPEVFDMTTVGYVSTPDFILKNDSIFSGRVKMIPIPKERALDIDTPFDFFIAEQMIQQGLVEVET